MIFSTQSPACDLDPDGCVKSKYDGNRIHEWQERYESNQYMYGTSVWFRTIVAVFSLINSWNDVLNCEWLQTFFLAKTAKPKYLKARHKYLQRLRGTKLFFWCFLKEVNQQWIYQMKPHHAWQAQVSHVYKNALKKDMFQVLSRPRRSWSFSSPRGWSSSHPSSPPRS